MMNELGQDKGINRTILQNIFVFLKSKTPRQYIHTIKQILLYRYVFISRLHPIKIQKICFFYKPEVPDFGIGFTYIKLGKKENILNPNSYAVIFEADLPYNLSKYNECFLDYSGLYALYKNNLIKEEYMLLIHYDTQILHKNWIEIIKALVRKNNVVFSNWAIDNERSEVAQWIYRRIDDVFIATHGQYYLSILKKNKFHEIPNTSQFACSRETFYKLMEFLLPIYEHILSGKELSFKYAHLLERAWGLFFALERYKTVPVIKDSHSQSGNYDGRVIGVPILTTALEKKVDKFSEILADK